MPYPRIVRSGNLRTVKKKNLAIQGKLKKRIWQFQESYKRESGNSRKAKKEYLAIRRKLKFQYSRNNDASCSVTHSGRGGGGSCGDGRDGGGDMLN